MESGTTEIIDFSGEKFSNFAIPCWVPLLLIFLIAIFDFYFMMAFSGSTIAILLSIVLIIIFFLYYSYVAAKSPGKLRKFSISNDDIRILLPQKPLFSIKWSEFEKIEIRLKKLQLKPFNIYQFYFFDNLKEQKITISLNDFHIDKITEILNVMKEYAMFMKKEFSSVKETVVFGVYFIEDLDN
ncbi:hypothetical protein LCGC14_0960490 [marine sediment metagenome]|uniref:YokE-like PH domain-containing protein n=1 Tax=marine sediment metagenome TaxID=412755 RepID=A0A0F9RL49_9ZZZZ|nr:MAG: hypothetical protein Lokiarch_19190 [Candidatus Lokiarchaeum sp. GC14_75]